MQPEGLRKLLALSVMPRSTSFLQLSIVLVFFAEIINTAMEKSLDLISQENNHLVQQTKDMMAAAVLVTAIGSLVVAAAVFAPYIWELIILLKK